MLDRERELQNKVRVWIETWIETAVWIEADSVDRDRGVDRDGDLDVSYDPIYESGVSQKRWFGVM